jgi:hypothetical protein
MIPQGSQQPQQVPVQVSVSTDKAGLAKVKGDFLGLAGDLAEPMLVLAAGGTKAEAAWSGLRGLFEARILGPLSLVAGASTAALIAINRLAKGYADLGMSGAAGLQSIETKFKSVLRSQELAAQRIRENVELAKETPYSQNEVMEANRALELLTQGALSSKEGMKLVGDATAVAGEEFSDVAKWVGRLYDALQSGAPIGEASMRLQEMGVINGQTRRTLESMVDSGAAFSEMWGVVEGQLRKSEGAMKDLSKNLEGLQSTYQDTLAVMQAKFSAGFIEGEMAATDTATKSLEALTPTVETLGKLLGSSSNAWEKWKNKVVTAVTSLPGFSQAATGAAIALTGLLAAISAGSAAAMMRFAASVIATTLAKNRMIKSTGALVVAQQAQAMATSELAAANVALATATTAVTQGNYAAAVSSLRLAATHTIAAGKTSAATVASIGLGAAWKGLTGVVGVLTGAIRAMLVSLVTNPFLLIAAAVMAVGAAFLWWTNTMKEARERAEAFAKATNDIVSSLQAQQRAIKTTTDLMRTHNAAVNELANARKALSEAERDGSAKDVANAKKRVAAIEAELAAINNFDRSKMSLTDEEKSQRVKRSEDSEKLKQLQREEARAKMSPQELAKDLRKEADEQQDKFENANRETRSQEVVKSKQSASAREATEISSELAGMEGKLREFREKRDAEVDKLEMLRKAGSAAGGVAGYVAGQATNDPVLEEYKARADAQEAEILARIEQLRSKVVDARSGLAQALDGDSTIEKFKARISLRNQASESQNQVASLEAEVANAGEDADPAKLEELDLAKRNLQALLDLAKQYGVALDAGAQSRDETDLEIAKAKLEKERDIVALREKQAAARRAEEEAAFQSQNSQLETEKAILGLKNLGLEGDLRAIAYEQQKLDLALARKKVSEEEYRQKTAILEAEAAAARESARRRSVSAVNETRINQLRLEEEWARRVGNTEAANNAAQRADELELAEIGRKVRQEAVEMFETEAERNRYIEERMNQERRAMEQSKRIREEDAARRRRDSRDDQALTYEELRAEILRYKGQDAAAEQADKEANRRRDERMARDQKKSYIEQGFSEKDAEEMAGRDVLAAQAQRELEKLKEAGRGQITASSLARIGGGGAVVGTDPVAQRLDKTNDLLKQILERTGGVPGVQ